MKIATITLKSASPVTFGKFHQTEKLNKEGADDYEKRTWKEKAHFTNDDYVKLPGIMFSNCIKEAAKYLSIQIPGKGKSTYTKNFAAGIIIVDDIVLSVDKEKLQGTAVHVPSDGTPGGTKRVMKLFPIVHEWQGTLDVYIGDDIITEDVFKKVLMEAGNLIGIGTWRPRNRGLNGRFQVVDVKWKDN